MSVNLVKPLFLTPSITPICEHTDYDDGPNSGCSEFAPSIAIECNDPATRVLTFIDSYDGEAYPFPVCAFHHTRTLEQIAVDVIGGTEVLADQTALEWVQSVGTVAATKMVTEAADTRAQSITEEAAWKAEQIKRYN